MSEYARRLNVLMRMFKLTLLKKGNCQLNSAIIILWMPWGKRKEDRVTLGVYETWEVASTTRKRSPSIFRSRFLNDPGVGAKHRGNCATVSTASQSTKHLHLALSTIIASAWAATKAERESIHLSWKRSLPQSRPLANITNSSFGKRFSHSLNETLPPKVSLTNTSECFWLLQTS